MRIFFAAVPFFLSGCLGTSMPSVATDPPELATIAPSLKLPCRGVSAVPDGPTAAQVVEGWAADRSALGACVRRHQALAEATAILEQQIEGPQ